MRYDVPDFAHVELVNWSRASWMGAWPHPLPRTQCGSAEGDFSSEWHLLGEPDDEPKPIPPNRRNAETVQAVWLAMPIGSLPRLVLKAEYPGRDNSGRREGGRDLAARRMEISLAQYEEALRYAVSRVEAAFKGHGYSLRA